LNTIGKKWHETLRNEVTKGGVKMKNNYLITIIIAVVVAGVAFFGGMKYQEAKTLSGNQFTRGMNGQGSLRTGGNRGGTMGGATIGEIVSLDSNSMAVKTQDNSTKIVIFSDKTTISKTDTASKSALKTGEKIAVFGISNSDGSVTAQNIQLNPMFRAGQSNRSNPQQ
jgi:hypothetical protein